MVRALVVGIILGVSVTGHSQQPQPTAALQSCLADATSGKDRKDLAKWIFLAMAAHPDMKEHAGATYAPAAEESSRRMAAMVVRLLADNCLKETRAVVAAGQVAQSFEVAFAG